MAFSDPMTFDSNQFARLSDGWYRNSASTADEPQDLIVKNTLVPDGISQHLIELRTVQNTSSTLVTAKDDVARIMFQVKYPSKAFSAADIAAQKDRLFAYLALSGVFDRLLLGER